MKKKNNVETFKTVVEFVISVGVGSIVGNVVRATSPSNLNFRQRMFIGVGKFVLSSMIKDQARDYVDIKINRVVDKLSFVGTTDDKSTTPAKMIIVQTPKDSDPLKEG